MKCAKNRRSIMKENLIVIVQCDKTTVRCSGYGCAKSFYNKTGKFTELSGDRYLAIGCGGCNGKGISAKLQHLEKVIKRDDLEKNDVRVHFSTCMSHDNTHHDRCPNISIMKKIMNKRGFLNIVEGTVINALAEERRKSGLYKSYE